MDKIDWRFEPETYLLEALEAHYDNPHIADHDHSDAEDCAIMIVEWLRFNNVELVYTGDNK